MSKQLRILTILGQRPAYTGSGILIQELWQCGRNVGDKNYLICGGYFQDKWYTEFGKDYSVISFSRKGEPGLLPFQIPGMSDVMPYESIQYGMLSSRQVSSMIKAYALECRRIVNSFRPNVIHIHHLWILTDILKLFSEIPVIVTVHGTDLKLAKTVPIHRRIIVRNIDRIRHILCVSKDMASDVVAEYGISKMHLSVIGNGFNQSIFYLPKTKPYNPKSIVLCAGKFVSWKGFRFAIRACAKLSQDYLLVILGSGSEKERDVLLHEAQLYKVNLLLPGHVSRTEIADWMRKADVFVLPSIHEPFGMVLLEALACGLRVVASQSGGPIDIVSQTLITKGFASLVPPLITNSQSDEHRYIRDLALAIDFQLSQKTTNHARRLIASSVAHMIWEAVYQNIRAKYVEIVSSTLNTLR